MSLQHRRVRASDGAEIAYCVARPEGGTALPGLAVFPSIFGITPELEEVLAAIAAAGVIAAAFDPFSRGDAGPVGEAETPRAFARLGALDRGRAAADFAELVALIRAEPGASGKVAGLGICLGGAFAFLAAADGLLDAMAAWHGSRIGTFLHRAGEVRCPLSLHYGDADPVVPQSEVEAIRAAFAGRADVEVALHPGAAHGFSQVGWSAYDPAAASAARAGVDRLVSGLSAPRR